MDITRVNIIIKEEYTNGYGELMTMVVDDRGNMYCNHTDYDPNEWLTLKDFLKILLTEEEQNALMEFIQKHLCDD